MSETTTTDQRRLTREEAVAEFHRLRAEIAEATKELTDDEYEALVEDLTRAVDDGLRKRVLESRGERR